MPTKAEPISRNRLHFQHNNFTGRHPIILIIETLRHALRICRLEGFLVNFLCCRVVVVTRVGCRRGTPRRCDPVYFGLIVRLRGLFLGGNPLKNLFDTMTLSGLGRGRLIRKVTIGNDVDVKAPVRMSSILELASKFEDLSPSRVRVKSGPSLNSLLTHDLPACVNVIHVNVDEKVLYVIFEDERSKRLRKELETSLIEDYSTPEADQLRVSVRDIAVNEILVYRDTNDRLHRVRILTVDMARHTGRALDVDTWEEFEYKENTLYQINERCCEVWFQVVKCRCELYGSRSTIQWRKENHFLLRNFHLLDKSWISALQLCEKSQIFVETIHKKLNDDVLILYVDAFKSPLIKNCLVTSIIFYCVPRLPSEGLTKIGWVTEVRRNGEVDIILDEGVWYGLRDIIHEIQLQNQFFQPTCLLKEKLFRELMTSFEETQFLAPFGGDWKELFRVKILSVESEAEVKVLYIDLGKEALIPIKNLAAPLRASFIPELVEVLPPQVVTVRMEDVSHELDLKRCLNVKDMLEFKPCYLKLIDEGDEKCLPTGNLFALDAENNTIKSFIDFVNADSEGRALQNGFETHDEYSVHPLTRAIKKNEDLTQLHEGAIAERKRQGIHACKCCNEPSPQNSH